MVDYTVDIAKEAFASEFVDDALVLKTLGGHKEEDRPVWLYLGLPIAARPDISWFFDRQYYLRRYPDIEQGQIDHRRWPSGWAAAAVAGTSARVGHGANDSVGRRGAPASRPAVTWQTNTFPSCMLTFASARSAVRSLATLPTVSPE